MACKGKCATLQCRTRNGLMYANGMKRCQVCDCWFKTESIWCPCCGWKLRVKPKGSYNKKRYWEIVRNNK